MKRIVLLTVILTAAAGTGYAVYPNEFALYAAATSVAAKRVWVGIEANPVPVLLAVGTFLLTVVYHKVMGKSLRESVEVAATKVTVVTLPSAVAAEADNAVLKRAKARTTRTQLLTDQIGIQNRQRKLPDALVKAEQEACYTEQAVADAERLLANKQTAHEEAVAKLESLRSEKATGDAELAEIEAELKKLAELV